MLAVQLRVGKVLWDNAERTTKVAKTATDAQPSKEAS